MKYNLEHTDSFVHLQFQKSVRMLSSAILNGGMQRANHFINLRVDANFNGECTNFENPKTTLKNLANHHGWQGTCVGMMTAANMTSFAQSEYQAEGIWIRALITSGLSNARCAGDIADYQRMSEQPRKTGTINILVLTNAYLTDSAMVECIMMITEAKSACLQQRNEKSKVSNCIATGTGTDSTAIACGTSTQIKYCGKHTLFGELLAKAVIDALTQSLNN